MATYLTIRRCLVVAALAGLVFAGCSKEKSERSKPRTREGVAKTIDLDNNIVSMICKDDKGGEHEIRGTIRDDTEVWINGRSHSLTDVREGDRVVVTGYQEGHGANKKLVATKVEVERPKDSDWKSTKKSEEATTKPKAPASSGETAEKESDAGKVKKDDPATGEKTP